MKMVSRIVVPLSVTSVGTCENGLTDSSVTGLAQGLTTEISMSSMPAASALTSVRREKGETVLTNSFMPGAFVQEEKRRIMPQRVPVPLAPDMEGRLYSIQSLHALHRR